MSISIREVEGILDDAPADVTPFLNTAERLVASAGCSLSYSAAIVDEITLYLAAHICCTVRPPKTSEKIGDSEDKFVQPSGQDLDSTRYGQVVKMLDTEGRLTSMTGTRIKLKALA